MKQVIVFPRGQLSLEDKASMAEADIIAVEADDPSMVVTCLPMSSMIGPDDVLLAALDGIMANDAPKSTMARSLAQRISKRAMDREQKQ